MYAPTPPLQKKTGKTKAVFKASLFNDLVEIFIPLYPKSIDDPVHCTAVAGMLK